MKKLGPWIETTTGGYVRYPDPSEGRTWDLDDSPWFAVAVSPCCGAPLSAPETLHFTWFLSDKTLSGRVCGDEKTLELAQEKADEALRENGWELSDG